MVGSVRLAAVGPDTLCGRDNQRYADRRECGEFYSSGCGQLDADCNKGVCAHNQSAGAFNNDRFTSYGGGGRNTVFAKLNR